MIGQSNASLYSNKLIGLLVLTRYQSTIILLDMSRSLPVSDNASIGSSKMMTLEIAVTMVMKIWIQGLTQAILILNVLYSNGPNSSPGPAERFCSYGPSSRYYERGECSYFVIQPSPVNPQVPINSQSQVMYMDWIEKKGPPPHVSTEFFNKKSLGFGKGNLGIS